MRKKILVLAAIAAGALFVVKKRRNAKAEEDLWREATSETSTAS